ncbi:LysR family transcriptional regulator [Brucella pseudintermedia]|uniref:LysR family transcriptional regulator n=1 Tax=Brucella pseudintermedia TaxID=370111 RepID=UPI00124DC93F|nr:LysR family transcriptional regulator [Brucella pseudintermedia]KAB2680910.1 LysR family transcriptional regulator [Brucella pseudintermedia]
MTGKTPRQHGPIEFRHLRYFIAAADHGSFRKAGAVLGLSQSAISRSVAHLEDQIGASVFHRHTWGVELTYAGQRFLRRARQIIRAIDAGAEEAGAIGRSERGSVRIGIYSSIASGFLAELLRTYSCEHCDVQIKLMDGDASEHVAAIRKLKLDVAFLTGTGQWPECDSVHLWSERVFAVLPLEHSLTRHDEIEWQDIAEEAFIVSESPPGHEIRDHLVRRLAGLGRHLEIQVQYVGRDNLLPLVAIGRGLTLVSEAMTVAQFPGITYRPIAGEILPFNAVWSPRNDNPALRRLLSIARSMATLSQFGGTIGLPPTRGLDAVP